MKHVTIAVSKEHLCPTRNFYVAANVFSRVCLSVYLQDIAMRILPIMQWTSPCRNPRTLVLLGPRPLTVQKTLLAPGPGYTCLL